MSARNRRVVGAVGALIAFAFTVVVATSLLGGDDDADARETDGAFITGMIPHHDSAIDMANMARSRAKHPEIKRLARTIAAAQTAEGAMLDEAHLRLFGEPPSEMDGHGSLWLSEEQMGMSGDMSELEDARPFDRAFIDMMIPHHQGAIRMARIQLEKGQDAELKRIAGDVISAQSQEIELMNSWREEWYGSESPAGGVPKEGEEAPSHDSMEH
jgi:uncharacterized protein (DUF305 family)